MSQSVMQESKSSSFAIQVDDVSDPMIRTVDMRVDYDGMTAVRDMNLTINRGEIFGLIGPNGAGKTSTIRVLATLQEPTYGDVFVGGFDVAEKAADVHRIIGYMPDLAPVYDDLRVWEFLDLFAAAHFVKKSERADRVDGLLHDVNLHDKRDVKSGTLSRGMKQRLCLAKTLLHDPEVLLLDEPASGIDPRGRIEMRGLLKDLASEGKTILISSHILTEMSDYCTSVGIMEKGKLVISGRVNDIIEQVKGHTKLIAEVIETDPRAVDVALAFARVTEAVSVDHRLEIVFEGDGADAAELLAHLVREKITVKAFYESRMNVEDIMLKVGADEVS